MKHINLNYNICWWLYEIDSFISEVWLYIPLQKLETLPFQLPNCFITGYHYLFLVNQNWITQMLDLAFIVPMPDLL